jgi:hypothetical protein
MATGAFAVMREGMKGKVGIGKLALYGREYHRILSSNTWVGRLYTTCTDDDAGSARPIPIRAGRMTAAPGRACRVRTAIANLRRGCHRIGKRWCESNQKRDSEMTTIDLLEPRVVGWSFDSAEIQTNKTGALVLEVTKNNQ